MSCIFCRIIAKEIPTNFIAETANMVVIKDISPKAPIHYLIIPKKHTENILHLDPQDQMLAGDMILMAKNIAQRENIPSFRLIANVGKESGQSVFHTHLHFLAGKHMSEQF